MNASDVLPAQFNAAAWFVDRSVAEGRGASPAFLYEDRTLTYADVQEVVNRTGNALLELGVEMETGVHRVPEGRGPLAPRHGGLLRDLREAGARNPAIRSGLLGGEALLRVRARRHRLPPDERGRAERAVPPPADAGVRVRDHRALPPDALLRRADALRRHARRQGRRGAVRHLVAAALRVGGRGAAGRDL